MPLTPFTYQKEDALHISKRKSALVGHEPRVGKSGIGILAADHVKARVVVIVCPANVIENWKTAVRDFRRGRWTAIIVSYNKAAELVKKLRMAGIHVDVLIVDESHFCKSRDAARTKAVFGTLLDGIGGLVEMSKRVYCLTGTPMPLAPTDLYPMLRSIAPELISDARGRPMSFSRFRDTYCKMQQTPFGMKIVGAKNYKKLKEQLFGSGFAIRRTRQEVFGRDILPPTTIEIKASTEFRAELKSLENSPEGKKIMEAMERGGLKALHKIEGAASQLRRLYGLAKVQGLASLIADELDEDPKMKIVIGCFHTQVIDAYANALRKYGVLVFDGRIDRARKVRNNERFLTDPKFRVNVCQILAAGVGLDFSSANDVVFAEQDWSGDNNEQFRARIFNPNSPYPKFTRFSVLPGSFDSRIANECARKLNASAKVFG